MADIRLPQYMWFEPREVPFPLPDYWKVTVNTIAGFDRPALNRDEIKTAITSPIGMPPLREEARGKKEVVIIFDDMTRSTPVSVIAPFILEELALAGITDDRIRFIAAVSNHQALDRSSLVKKLGNDILGRYPVYNHCPFLNCVDLGTTSYGTRVQINAEVMSCDLKITIGQILPHPIYGLSGGGKMVMPGVSSYESVTAHHGHSHQAWKDERVTHGLSPAGVIGNNPMNDDAMEIATMAGIDMVVNCVTNGWGEPVRVFAGALEPTYAAAVKEGKSNYLAQKTTDNDIVILNNFVKASEFSVPLSVSVDALKSEGGSLVLISSSPSGQVIHYLFDDFGKSIGGALTPPIITDPRVKQLIIYNEFPEARILASFADKEKVLVTDDWQRVIETLEQAHSGTPRVAVYPNADTQYFAD